MGDSHRIFISLPIPADSKEGLLDLRNFIRIPIVRWTRPDHIHLTLVFIGSVRTKELQEIQRTVEIVSKRHTPFSTRINKVILGPSVHAPRMIWGEIDPVPHLLQLQKDIEESLLNNTKTGYHEKDTRPYHPHLTLARFDPGSFRPHIRETAKILETFMEKNYEFPVSTINVMESTLTKTGPLHDETASFQLT